MNETTAADSLVSLGRNLYEIADRLGCSVFDDETLPLNRYEVLRSAARTFLYVHPRAHEAAVAHAVAELAARRWGVAFDANVVGRGLLRRLGALGD